MEKIIQLLNDYKTFTEEQQTDDLGAFAEALAKKYKSEKEEVSTQHSHVNAAGLTAMSAFFLGGLMSFVEVWIKMAYEDLPLKSVSDFGILKTVERLDAPSKSEIADKQIMEKSTCIESIKRLIKAGVLAEFSDEQDKRIKRVVLTKEGKKLVPKVDQQMINLSELLMGNLTDDEKLLLIPALKKLSHFHHDLYDKRNQIDIKSRYDL